MDKIGPYQILELLHRGPQPLHKAKAPDGRVVALKSVPVANLTPETRERFLREAETCRTLNHPRLVQVYEAGEADGVLYQAMELLDGADLGKVLAEGRHFTWNEKLSIMEQVCEGLQVAHEHNLVHRDIKPANLFLENSGSVRLLDFGMVRQAESELTRVGSSLGTANYMSPEQIHGQRCTAASDVFSAGIVFYQLASGRHPFSTRERSLAQVVSAIVFEAPPKLSEICPDAPEGLEFLLNRALEKDPTRRLQNGGELKQAVAICRLAMAQGLRAGPDEKTRVMANPAAPVPVEDAKTQVFQRPKLSVPVAPPAPPPVPAPTPAAAPVPVAPSAPAPARVAPAAAPRFRYCSSCTTANPPDAVVCLGCGYPLGVAAGTPTKSSQMPLYLAIGAAVLLAIALLVVLLVKQ